MWTPEQQDALRVLADVYIKEDLADQAVLVLEALQRERPESQPVLAALCYAYLLTDRYREALRISDQYLRLVDATEAETAPIWLLRSRASWALGNAEEARAQFARYQAVAVQHAGSGLTEDAEQ